MKVNKKRTIAGIFAIALATSLITTVMCFATSANKMLTDFLGSDYGEYGGAYSLMLGKPFSAAIAFDEDFNTKFVFAEHKTAEKRGNVKRYKK